MTALKSIRRFCVTYCMNGNQNEVKLCPTPQCALHDYRRGKLVKGARLTVLRSIKAFCTDCSEGIRKAKECPHTDCELYPYRTGRLPKSAQSRRLKRM